MNKQATSPVLLLDRVTKTIGKHNIVDNLSFYINKGEIVGLLGPNGAGKTTTIRMITGLIGMSSGDVRIKGHSIKNNFSQAIAQLGAIIENPEFYPYMTGLDNLKQYVRMSDNIPFSRIEEVVKLLGMEQAMNKRVKAYSLGMRQRLGIAQALLHNPQLLILDEPTNGLDPAGIREMRDYMRAIADQGIAILISSHLLSEIEQTCHRAVIIQNGKLVTQTTLAATSQEDQKTFISFRVNRLDTALSVLKSIPEATLKHTNRESSELILSLQEDAIPQVAEKFCKEGIRIYRMVEQKNTLEDQFMVWTGGNQIA